ncbi:MAG TPA: alpha,alpha-trehalase TreF [Puia sp.]|nr:alpha,alpha-trehalase TreF [Puia sp.]
MKSPELLYLEDLKELFVDVQRNRVFADQKFFTDCVPKMSVHEVLSIYSKEKKEKDFDLKEFCKRNFEYPVDESTGFVSDRLKTLEEHINVLWDILTKKTTVAKGTLIPLPYSFVVPGGRFREIYYWDSYFTMLGLQVSKRINLIENMIENFAYLIDEFGFIPNGNRSYFLSRSQPPFFSLMVKLLSEEKGQSILLRYLPQLEKEYRFWMKGKEFLDKKNKMKKHVVMMPDGEILNRYWDDKDTPREEAYTEDDETANKAEVKRSKVFRDIRAAAESGWDFSSRWFRDACKMSTIYTTDIVPVDLNCLMYNLEKFIGDAYMLKKEKDLAEKYYKLSVDREAAIHKYLWNEKNENFIDYDLVNDCATNVISAVTAFPMFVNIATKKQGEKTAKILKQHFLKPGGIVTTLNSNNQQWDAPNGWAPLQWVVYKGLVNYGFEKTAVEVKNSWTSTVETIFRATGKITEKYNVIDTNLSATGGEYPNQDGFGWTNGVYMKLRSDDSS